MAALPYQQALIGQIETSPCPSPPQEVAQEAQGPRRPARKRQQGREAQPACLPTSNYGTYAVPDFGRLPADL